jgi:hypothetical protein
VEDLTVATIDTGLRNYYAICVERFSKRAVERCKSMEEEGWEGSVQ